MIFAANRQTILNMGDNSGSTLAEIEAVIGHDQTMRLVYHLGGQQLYVPSLGRSLVRLKKPLELEAMIKFCQHFGGTTIQLPLATAEVARWLRAQGRSLEAISKELRVHPRSVHRWVSNDRGHLN